MGLCFSNFSYICNVMYCFCFLLIFLLFIGLFSKTCKWDILNGGLQPHGSLSVKGHWSWSLGRQFCYSPTEPNSICCVLSSISPPESIHPFGKMHPTLIFLPGVFSAQIFLGKNRIFLKSFRIFRKKNPKHGPTLVFPNSCRIQLKGSAQFWFLP